MTAASLTQIDTLLVLVQPLASAASTKLHCVRCHKSFFEHTNNSTACRILHHDYGDGERTEIGDDAITITVSCCGIEYDSEEGPDTKDCIVAEHTTLPEEVVYYDEDEDDGGNRFVVTCAVDFWNSRTAEAREEETGMRTERLVDHLVLYELLADNAVFAYLPDGLAHANHRVCQLYSLVWRGLT